MIYNVNNNRQKYVFTSESVSEGHPDKVCDQISDSLVDAIITKNPYARTAIETTATTNFILIAGEISGAEGVTKDDMEKIIREKIRSIGYEQEGFHWKTVEIKNLLHSQSADIAQGVDASSHKDEGAGDQGIMFGYACDETESLMPAPVHYANNILKELAISRKNGEYPELQPDAKSQISLVYENGRPIKAVSVVVSTQHKENILQNDVREIVRSHVEKVLPNGWMCDEHKFFVNPTGKFVIGGPDGDAGLTGRKIIVDTYGGAAPHGGGAFSGKDPTKVDRSAAYAARYLAKNVVAAGLSNNCIIQISYAIGVSHPISFYVNTGKTSKVDDARLEQILPEMMNLSPRNIREYLGLNRPIYARTATYGHFGRKPTEDGGFSWEKTDLANDLRNYFGG